MEKGLSGILVAIIVVIGGVVGVSMLPDEVTVDTTQMDLLKAQIVNLEEQIADAEDQAVLDEYLALIEELQAQIDELEEEPEFPYMITKRYETELNQSFSAWGPCGCAEHHIKDKALQRAEDFTENLEAQNDNVDFISIKYMGLNREFLGNDSVCYVTYTYDVDWLEYEYEDIWIYR